MYYNLITYFCNYIIMKRIISLLCWVTLLLSTNSSVFAWNSYDSWYKSPILKNDFYFTAKRDW